MLVAVRLIGPPQVVITYYQKNAPGVTAGPPRSGEEFALRRLVAQQLRRREALAVLLRQLVGARDEFRHADAN